MTGVFVRFRCGNEYREQAAQQITDAARSKFEVMLLENPRP